MVTFATLFLGLVVGIQPLEVLVGDGVASVEIQFDGELVGVLRGAPWALDLDFGEELAPHHLLAVAFDAAGRELARTEQWVNLPRDPAEAGLVVESEGEGSRVARLTWQSLESAIPEAIRVSFDGQPLELEDPERIELPPHDDEKLHFLRAELDFSENVSTVVEVTYGGFYADQVNTELTALPLLLTGGRKLPDEAELQGWVSNGTEPLRVVAAEKGAAEVVLVRGSSAAQVFNRLARSLVARVPSATASMSTAQRLRHGTMTLKGDVRMRYLWPRAERHQGRGQMYHLFPGSVDFPARQQSLFWVLYTVRQPSYPLAEQRLIDALAVAGMNAAARNRRRAVVLLLGEEVVDNSYFSPAQVEAYLQHLRVPLLVWSLVPPSPERTGAWSSVVDASTVAKLQRATRDLNQLLDKQRIVWLDGFHLPQGLTLTELAVGVRPAG